MKILGKHKKKHPINTVSLIAMEVSNEYQQRMTAFSWVNLYAVEISFDKMLTK